MHAPDLAAKPVDDGRTTTGRVLAALPRDAALAEVRATDRRPLLIVRECDRCKGTDDALLDRRLDNEKTILMTRWFRCVKLPNTVLEDNPPYRNLFQGEHPPHLFLCRYDGSEPVALFGEQTQSQLWDAMEALVAREYQGNIRTAVKGLLRLLNDYDALDSRERELRVRLEETIDKDGDKSLKVRDLRKKIDALQREREQLKAREDKLGDLGMRPLDDEAAAKPSAAEAKRG